MKFVIQRVTEASCTVDNQITGEIKNGFCVLIGVAETDTRDIADKMIKKMLQMRIFADDQGKTNLSLKDVDGNLLLISQFTLYANCKKGNRPSFIDALEPCEAERLYKLFCQHLRNLGVKRVDEGIFGADMQVSLVNDGPVTILYDTDIWSKKK